MIRKPGRSPAPNTAVIVANGTLPRPELMRRELERAEYILAADGGANLLAQLGIEPHAVIGDFDSIDAVAISAAVLRINAPDQNYTDLEKAVLYCRSLGYTAITLLGATGNRLDHTFAALAILCKYDLRLVDDVGTAVCVCGPNHVKFTAALRTTVSLLPCGPVSGLNTSGLKWNLHDADFSFAQRDGTSNEAIAASIEVSVGSGYVIVYLHHAVRE